MQRVWQVALLLAAAFVLAGCDVGRAAKGGARGAGGEPLPENIDGTYLIQAMNYLGEIRLPDEVAEMRPEYRKVVFADGTMTTFAGSEPLVEKMVIDRTKTPAQVTFTHELPAGEVSTTHGVMAMIGGQLTVCRFVGRRGDLPTEITNGPNYITWKLKKENAGE